MPIIQTHLLQPGPRPDGQQIYNGLDACLTFEVFEEMSTLFDQPPEIYAFERALQAPALDMMLRGFRIDEFERQKGISWLKSVRADLERKLQLMAFAVWDQPLNPRSTQQLQKFFYGRMGLPEQWISQKGERKLSMNRETLEKLEIYFHARPIIATILDIRDVSKQLDVLETQVDPDGRMRTSYNIGGTETGRWSSSSSVWGTGTNLQNLQRDDDVGKRDSSGKYIETVSLRRMFIADPGYKIIGVDLEQAESREVGWLCGTLFNDWSYLDACIKGDLHTTTCKLIWRDLPWTGDPSADRRIAEQPFYRNCSYRDMSKRGGHGSNYFGTPWTMARHLKVPSRLMENFESDYFAAFPGIPKWHRWVAEQLQTTQQITTPFGRRRHFFGRPNDDTTLREAIAYSPQSTTADRLNLALWRVWKHLGTRVQLLAQVHDALYVQFREGDDEADIVKQILALIDIPMTHQGRSYTVPGEAKSGWNWGAYHEELNPDGLRKFKIKDDRKRHTGWDRVM